MPKRGQKIKVPESNGKFMKIIMLLASYLLLPLVVFSSVPATISWASPEIIGGGLAQKEEIRDLLADLSGSFPISNLENIIQEKCREIKSRVVNSEIIHIGCNVVIMPLGDVHFVIDFVSKNENERIDFNESETILKEAPESNPVDNDDISCAKFCDNSSRRADAFYSLNNNSFATKDSCNTALSALSSKDVNLRNAAAQHINFSQGGCFKYFNNRDLVKSIGVLISRPNHSDRNKGLAILEQIASRQIYSPDEDDISCEILELRELVGRLAEESILDNVGGVAKRVLQEMDIISDRKMVCR